MANLEALEAKKKELNDKFRTQRNQKKDNHTDMENAIKQTTKESLGPEEQKKIRVTVSLPPNMFYALEKECRKVGATKNGYIVSMLSKKLDIE